MWSRKVKGFASQRRRTTKRADSVLRLRGSCTVECLLARDIAGGQSPAPRRAGLVRAGRQVENQHEPAGLRPDIQ